MERLPSPKNRPSVSNRAGERHREGQGGFSLIEIIVALAILSLSLAVLTPAITNNIRISAEARAQSVARLHMQSLLSEVGVTKPLEAGEQMGVFEDGQSWRLVIEPYGSEEKRAQWGVAPWRVTATVYWRKGERSRSITTLRIGRKSPA